MCTPIRNAFLRAAATLLIIPERYQYVIEQLKLSIAPNRRRKIYNTTLFGDENHLGENEMARFLTSAGVTTDEAESWRPWAVAYAAMEIDDHPSSSHTTEGLQQAIQRAHELINGDTKWVIRNIPPLVPGYYKPTSETPCVQRNIPRTTHHSGASSSTNTDTEPASSAINSPTSSSTTAKTSSPSVTAEISPSSSSTLITSTSSTSDNVDKSDKLVDYGDGLDKDTSMGPA